MEPINNLTTLETEILVFMDKHTHTSTEAIRKRFRPKRRSNSFDDIDEVLFNLETYHMIIPSGERTEKKWDITSTGMHAAHNQEILDRRSFRFQAISFVLGLVSGVLVTVIGGVILAAVTGALAAIPQV